MTSLFSYRGRRVVVTGGSSGVGAALLDVLAELDVAHVTVLDLNPPTGPHDAFVATDLADEHAVRAAITTIGDTGNPVDALFNNAGVADTQPLADRPLGQLPRSAHAVRGSARPHARGQRDRQHRVDRRPPVAQAGQGDQRAPRPRHRRRVARRRSNGSTSTRRSVEEGPYNFSKAVVELLHIALVAIHDAARRAHERRLPRPDRHAVAGRFPRDRRATRSLDWNIREMAGRAVAPREVASLLAFLGCPAASYVNGVNVDIDGGFFAALATGQVDYSGRT